MMILAMVFTLITAYSIFITLYNPPMETIGIFRSINPFLNLASAVIGLFFTIFTLIRTKSSNFKIISSKKLISADMRLLSLAIYIVVLHFLLDLDLVITLVQGLIPAKSEQFKDYVAALFEFGLMGGMVIVLFIFR
uniref:DUF4149 domain-containing protein n=1 Tax=Panagrolaimus sp. JU765 TaxID=591449 RepID=A0AC34Q7T7_9BILA